MRELMCHTCGKTFVVYGRGRPNYCSEQCRKEKHREFSRRRYRKGNGERRKKLPEALEPIAEINRQAFAEGLSYGKFVAKYGL